MSNKKRNIEDVKLWLSEYNSGKISLVNINKKYKTDLVYQCKIYNLFYKKSKYKNEHRKHEIIYNFSEIKNDTEAYILGLLFADGYICHNSMGIKLIKSDDYLIESIKNYICPSRTILYEKNSVKFVLSSTEVVKNLMNHGILYKKSSKEMKVPTLSKDLYPSFIRGVFDGDGTVFYDRKYIKVNICNTSLEFLKDLEKILNTFNIECNFWTEKRKGKLYKIFNYESVSFRDMYRLFIKPSYISNFTKLIYNNSTLHLNRKSDILFNYVNTEVNNQITKG